MPDLAPYVDVLFWGQHDFPISFSNRDTSRNAWNRRYGDFIKRYEVPLSRILNGILQPDHIQTHPLPIRPSTKSLPYRIMKVSIEYLRRMWHADRGRSLLRTPSPVPFGTCIYSLVETNPFPNLSWLLWTKQLEHPSVLSIFCFILFLDHTTSSMTIPI